MEATESFDLWPFERALLFHQRFLPDDNIADHSAQYRKDLKRLTSLIEHINAIDVYEAIVLLEEEFGRPLFLKSDPKTLNFKDSKELFNYILEAATKYLNRDVNSGLERAYILGASVLLLSIFCRANWTGPPLTILSPSEQTLADSYKRKVVTNGNVEEIGLNKLLIRNGDSSALSAYAQEKLAEEFTERCILGSPDISLLESSDDREGHELRKSIISTLAIHGEVVYPGVRGTAYFYASIALFYALNNVNLSKRGNGNDSLLKSLGIWQCRLAFAYQRIIQDALHSPCWSLMKSSVLELAKLLHESEVLNADVYALFDVDWNKNRESHLDVLDTAVNQSDNDVVKAIYPVSIEKLDIDNECKALLLVELLQRLPYYNLNRLFEPVLQQACEYAEFQFDFTGQLGVRRKHQTTPLPQLVVSTDSAVNGSGMEKSNATLNGPTQVSLKSVDNDTDILEVPKLQDSASNQSFSPLEQCLLLSRGLHIINSIPSGDELGLQFVNAIVVKCLASARLQSHWLLSSVALWLRCKTEYHRVKTLERATLQLHSLYDSFYEQCQVPGERLEYFWQCCYPAMWDIKVEMAKRMIGIGSFITAFEIYKKLQMFEHASQCLIMANRLEDAKELITNKLKQNPTPMLWCYLGDVEDQLEHYETARKLSNGKCARAHRAIGAYYYKKGDLNKVIEALSLAICINPMHESSLFLLGCCYLKTQNTAAAIAIFGRAVALNPEAADAWANLSSAHFGQQNIKEAKHCIEQAIKHNGCKWQFWDTLLRLAVTTKDVAGVCRAVENILNLGRKTQFEPWIFAFLIDSVTKYKTNDHVAKLVASTLELVTREIVDNDEIWYMYALYHSHHRRYVEALEATFKQYRVLADEIELSLTHAQPDEEKQQDHEVKQLKRLTNCLGSLVALLKRASPSERRKHRHAVVSTLQAIKLRLKIKSDALDQQFKWEVDQLIESAEVEDILLAEG